MYGNPITSFGHYPKVKTKVKIDSIHISSLYSAQASFVHKKGKLAYFNRHMMEMFNVNGNNINSVFFAQWGIENIAAAQYRKNSGNR